MSRGGRCLLAGTVLAVVAMLPGCASMPIPLVDERMLAAASASGMQIEQIHRGYRLMVTACAACHAPVHPDSMPMADWDEVMPRMLVKSKLTAVDGDRIRAYVVAARRASLLRQDS